jgi:hypothetical protein
MRLLLPVVDLDLFIDAYLGDVIEPAVEDRHEVLLEVGFGRLVRDTAAVLDDRRPESDGERVRDLVGRYPSDLLEVRDDPLALARPGGRCTEG